MKKLKISFEKNNKPKIKYRSYPRIDVNRMCFDSEDNIEQMQVEHIKKIKKKVLKRYLIPTILILLILMVVLSLFCYSLGDTYTDFDNTYTEGMNDAHIYPVLKSTIRPVLKNTDVVYITENGKKYHKSFCQYVSENGIPIDINKAIDKGYSPCKKCFY